MTVQLTRDFVGEMREIIDKETGGGAYVSREIASKIVTRLHAEDPALLEGWLDAQAETMIWRAINDRDRSHRSYVRAVSGRSVFREVVDRAEQQGSVTPITDWLSSVWVVASGERKPLAIMTGEDCMFVADGYRATRIQAKMHEAFHRAIGKKVGPTGKVSDHFTNDQLAAAWASISR